MHVKRPVEVSRGMNWEGAVVGLVMLGMMLADIAILGRTTAGYVGLVMVVALCATILRTTASRRSSRRG